jgi:hypothetical protein
VHASLVLQPLDVVYVDIAPDASWLSRRKTNRVTGFVQIFSDAVDPAEAERLVQCFRVADAFLAEDFLWKPTSNSDSRPWFCSSQARNFSGELKNVGLIR